MSNRQAKKARRAAGEKFVKPTKAATPLHDRSTYKEASSKKKLAMNEARGIELNARQRELINRQKTPKQPARNFTR